MKTELLGPLESKILEILWQSGTALKPAEVKANLKGKYAYTTIMTVLKRLADKNILHRTLEGKVFLYYPSQSREEFFKLAISQFVDKLQASGADLKLLHDYLVDNQK